MMTFTIVVHENRLASASPCIEITDGENKLKIMLDDQETREYLATLGPLTQNLLSQYPEFASHIRKMALEV